MNKELDYIELSKKTKEEIMTLFKTNENGLGKDVADARLEEYGENIASNKKRKPLYILLPKALKINSF